MIRIGGRPGKALWIGLTLLLGTVPSPSVSSPADSARIARSADPPDWSRIPAEERRRLYWNRDEVPAFPENADSLLHVGNWPRSRVIGGEACSLFVSKFGHRGTYSAHYAVHSPDVDEIVERQRTYPGSKLQRGPSSIWRGDSTLVERSYSAPPLLRTWSYDSAGKLIHYESGNLISVAPFLPWLSVWFSPEGNLIACEVDGSAYWMGRRVIYREMFEYLAEYYGWPKGLR